MFREFQIIFVGFLFLASCSNQQFDIQKTGDTVTQIDSLNALISGETAFDTSRMKQADSLFTIALAFGYEKGMAEAAANYIYLLTRNYQYEQAINFVSNNNSEFEKIGDQILKAKVYEEIGILYYDLGDYDNAYVYYSSILKISEQSQNQKKVSEIYSRIGLLFEGVDPEKSKDNLNQALKISTKIMDSAGIARDLNNIGIYYMVKQQYDSARFFLNQALQLNKSLGNWNFYSRNLGNLAHIEKLEGNYKQSENIYKEMKNVHDSINDLNLYAGGLLHMGDLYLKMKQYILAIPYFQQALELGEKFGWTAVLMHANQGLYLCNKNLGKIATALDHHEFYAQFKDSLLSKQNQQELIRLELKNKNEQLIQDQKWNHQKQRYFFLAILFFLILFLVFLYQLFRKQKLKVSKEKLERTIILNELDFKRREMTTNALSLMKKNELLSEIADKLIEVRNKAIKDETKYALDQISVKLEKATVSSIWDDFEKRFNEVHQDFYNKLHIKFPNLSPHEQRLCAFLKLNMSSKDISELTGQKVESLEKARTRLRKKLGLTNTDISLVTFLSQF
jgi:tetratricopeptide (TPR) repeat protein